MSHGQEASIIAERTQICLGEMNKLHKGDPANVILLLGETGAGKSSLLEYLTETSGHSEESANSVTKKFQIEKSNTNGKDYYIMDTPGFDHGVELEVFHEVVRGVEAVRLHARIIGVFLVIPMHHARVNEMDQKLLRFTLALCGDEYINQVTVVTTFWEAPKTQQQKYNTRLANLFSEVERLWQVERVTRHYQHGRKYKDGKDTGIFLEWDGDRNDIIRYAKDMIHRHYECTNLQDPRIVQELRTRLVPERTAAGQFLGLTPLSTPDSTFDSASSSSTAPGPEKESGKKHKEDIPQKEPSTKDPSREDPPKTSSSSDGASRQGTSAQTDEKESWGQAIGDFLSGFFRNVHFEASVGSNGGPGLNISSGPCGPSSTDRQMGPRHNGCLDHLSVVDTFKKAGLDSSPENRARVGQSLGIVGTPGTADYNDKLRREVQRRF